jgi:large subunit ribosomal protein L4
MEIKIYDRNCNEKGSVKLPDVLIAPRVDANFLYEVVKYYLANQRRGTASTKTRAEVRGGGRKPWRQKHTGRARQGSIRSPLWRGGGVVFGPKPRDFSIDMPAKKLKLALKQVITARAKDGKIYLFESFDFEKPKTKEFVNILNKLNLLGKKVMVVFDTFSDNLAKSMRNIEDLDYKRASDVNAYDLITSDVIILNEKAIDVIKERVEG